MRLNPFARQLGLDVYDGEDSAVARLQGQLAAAGYLAAIVRVDTVARDEEIVVVFRVRLGRPAVLGGWDISGAESLTSGQVASALPKPGSRFTQAALERATAGIARVFESNGFPLISVRTQALRQEDGLVWPVLSIDPGPRVRVAFLEFAGKPGTRPGLLARTAGFSPRGYSRAAAGEWVRNLDQSGLARVDSQAIVRRDSLYGVRLYVTGERRNRAVAVVGYDVGQRRLTGFARVGFLNLYDTGRRLEAQWRSAWARTSYGVSYTEPWVLGTNVDVTGGARQETVDTTYAQTALTLVASARVASGLRVELSTGYDRFAGAASAATNQLWGGTGLRASTFDVPENPQRGISLGVETRVGTRTQDSVGAVVTKVALDFGSAVSVATGLVWSTAFGARAEYSAADLSEPELYRMGGPGTVRGYRESEFAALRMGWMGTELRYLLDRDSRVYPFFDLGAYEGVDGWRLAPAYGVGARVSTRAGVLGFDYGVAFRDSPLRGKVHLSLETEF